MVHTIDVHCPLCQIPMVVKELENRTSEKSRKSILYCQSCGHGLKDAFRARLTVQDNTIKDKTKTKSKS